MRQLVSHGTISRHKQKLVAVKQRPTERCEAVFADDRCGVGEFRSGGRAAEGELVGVGDLFLGIGTSLLLHACRKCRALLLCEDAVEEVEGLDGGGAFDAAGGALAGVGAVEGTEDGFGFAAHFMGVDHAALIVGIEGLDGIEAAEATALIEEIEAAAIHLQIQATADGEHGVVDGFGFEAAGRVAPEVAVVGVDGVCGRRSGDGRRWGDRRRWGDNQTIRWGDFRGGAFLLV